MATQEYIPSSQNFHGLNGSGKSFYINQNLTQESSEPEQSKKNITPITIKKSKQQLKAEVNFSAALDWTDKISRLLSQAEDLANTFKEPEVLEITSECYVARCMWALSDLIEEAEKANRELWRHYTMLLEKAEHAIQGENLN
jgi:hypothetical protein